MFASKRSDTPERGCATPASPLRAEGHLGALEPTLNMVPNSPKTALTWDLIGPIGHNGPVRKSPGQP